MPEKILDLGWIFWPPFRHTALGSNNPLIGLAFLLSLLNSWLLIYFRKYKGLSFISHPFFPSRVHPSSWASPFIFLAYLSEELRRHLVDKGGPGSLL